MFRECDGVLCGVVSVVMWCYGIAFRSGWDYFFCVCEVWRERRYETDVRFSFFSLFSCVVSRGSILICT